MGESNFDTVIASEFKLGSNPVAANGVGAVAGSGAVATETSGDGVHKTVIVFTNRVIALADAAGVVAYGGSKVYDFPAGYIQFLGASCDLDITKSSAGVNDDWDGDFGVGRVTTSNNSTLSSTEQDLIPTTPTPQAVAGVTTADGVSTGTEAPKIFDGHTTAIDAYLNFLVDDADHDVTTTPCNLIVNGSLTIVWANLGDN